MRETYVEGLWVKYLSIQIDSQIDIQISILKQNTGYIYKTHKMSHPKGEYFNT